MKDGKDGARLSEAQTRLVSGQIAFDPMKEGECMVPADASGGEKAAAPRCLEALGAGLEGSAASTPRAAMVPTPAQFGKRVGPGGIRAELVLAELQESPPDTGTCTPGEDCQRPGAGGVAPALPEGCGPLRPAPGKVVLVHRGGCAFTTKVAEAQVGDVC
jgi:hypothetical protein